MIKDSIKYKIISDHLGSPRMIVDPTGNIVKDIRYDSFGNIISDSNEDFSLPFRFAGGIYDEDTNLLRFGARDYDPKVGRWTAKEPLGFDGSRNFYVYVGNNPINLLDITGLKPGDPFATANEAAKDAMEYIYEDSKAISRELGGIIYEGSDGCFYATDPLIGTSNSLTLGNIYPDFGEVAFYHSHPSGLSEGSLLLSDENGDISFADKHNIDAYLINTLGDMSKYDYEAMSTSKIGESSTGSYNESDNFYNRSVVFEGENNAVYY